MSEQTSNTAQAALFCHELVTYLKKVDEKLRITIDKELDLNVQRSLLTQKLVNTGKIETLVSVIEMLVQLEDENKEGNELGTSTD